MAEGYLYNGLPLVAKHVPDYSMELDGDGNKSRIELPGHVEIGVDVEGAFVPLAKIGAVRLGKKIERAKANAAARQDESATSQQ